jgi:hypothetical protein
MGTAAGSRAVFAVTVVVLVALAFAGGRLLGAADHGGAGASPSPVVETAAP